MCLPKTLSHTLIIPALPPASSAPTPCKSLTRPQQQFNYFDPFRLSFPCLSSDRFLVRRKWRASPLAHRNDSADPISMIIIRQWHLAWNLQLTDFSSLSLPPVISRRGWYSLEYAKRTTISLPSLVASVPGNSLWSGASILQLNYLNHQSQIDSTAAWKDTWQLNGANHSGDREH